MKKINKPIIKKILLKKRARKKEHNYKLMKGFLIALILFSIVSLSFNIFELVVISNKKVSSNLGTELSFVLENNETQTKSITLPSNLIASQNLNEKATVKNNTSNSIYLRFKIQTSFSENNEIKTINNKCDSNEDFMFKDGYYYYNNLISANEEIIIFNNIISQNINSNCDYYSITISIETFSNITNAETFWEIPTNWLA